MSLKMAAQNTQIHGLIPCAAATGRRIMAEVSMPAVTGKTRRTANVVSKEATMKNAIRPSTNP